MIVRCVILAADSVYVHIIEYIHRMYTYSHVCMVSQILSTYDFHSIRYIRYIRVMCVWLHIMYTHYTY